MIHRNNRDSKDFYVAMSVIERLQKGVLIYRNNRDCKKISMVIIDIFNTR